MSYLFSYYGNFDETYAEYSSCQYEELKKFQGRVKVKVKVIGNTLSASEFKVFENF